MQRSILNVFVMPSHHVLCILKVIAQEQISCVKNVTKQFSAEITDIKWTLGTVSYHFADKLALCYKHVELFMNDKYRFLLKLHFIPPLKSFQSSLLEINVRLHDTIPSYLLRINWNSFLMIDSRRYMVKILPIRCETRSN